MENKEEAKQCSLCNEQYYGLGNNAYPFEGRCCDLCNEHMVIRARLLISQSKNPQRIIERIKASI